MPATTIVAPETLAKGLGDPDWLLIDARFSLDDEGWGRRAHAEAHIPGALYADLSTDLAGEIIPGKTGRRPLPDFQIWRKTLSRWGVTPNTQVVVYDSAGGMMAATRVWWMLRWAGHDAVAVLDGGLPAWLREGRPVDKTVAVRTPSSFEGRERDSLLADLDLVDKRRRDPAWAVFDSRSEEGFHGSIAIDRLVGDAESLALRLDHEPRNLWRRRAPARRADKEGQRWTARLIAGFVRRER